MILHLHFNELRDRTHVVSGTEIVPLFCLSGKNNCYLFFDLIDLDLPNTRKSIGNGFSMEKQVGVMVRNSFRVQITVENGSFEVE